MQLDREKINREEGLVFVEKHPGGIPYVDFFLCFKIEVQFKRIIVLKRVKMNVCV